MTGNEVACSGQCVQKERELARIGIKVTGMSCAACSARLEKGLSGMAGVSAARVNLAAEKATVDYDPALIKPEQMVEKIRQFGFDVPREKLDLVIGGMSCAACAARIEKKLKTFPGVAEVNVNLATEKASIAYYPAEVNAAALVNAVVLLGFEARSVGDENPDREKDEREKEINRQLFLFVFAAVFSAPLFAGMLGMMAPFERFFPHILHNVRGGRYCHGFQLCIGGLQCPADQTLQAGAVISARSVT